MKTVDVKQGSKEWLNWRKTVITATDCPSIMGTSPYQTAYKCWQRKLGLVAEQRSNPAIEKGKRLEPEARESFIFKTGIKMIPVCVESSEFDFLGASLDGISECNKALLEIKCSEPIYNQAKKGKIADHFLDQMQAQLLVTGADINYFYAYSEEDKDGIIIEMKKDPNFEDLFLPKAREFWRRILYFEAPPMSESDWCCMNDNLDWQKYAIMYKEIDASTKALEDKKDYIRKKLIEICAHEKYEGKNCQGNGLKAMKTTIKGRIAYDEIPQLEGVDLEKHRKESTTSWKILIDK